MQFIDQLATTEMQPHRHVGGVVRYVTEDITIGGTTHTLLNQGFALSWIRYTTTGAAPAETLFRRTLSFRTGTRGARR
ncbi:MAG: hypothetical protein AB7G11_02700 [Phycisphaerales bacterium]